MRPEPFRQSGDGLWASIVEVDLLNLVTYITTWTDATLDDMAAFMYKRGVNTPTRQSPNALRSWTSQRKGHPPKANRRSDWMFSFVSGFFGTVLLLLVYQVP